MVLVDTSVWIDHLRAGDVGLVALLESTQVLSHPFVLGEIALGTLRQRDQVLDALQSLPQAALATDDEVISFIEARHLYGLGIGYVDAHLLASVHLHPGTRLWTRDTRLEKLARDHGVAH